MKRVICVSQSESTMEDDTIPAREDAVNKTETDVATRRRAFAKNVFSRRRGDAKLYSRYDDRRKIHLQRRYLRDKTYIYILSATRSQTRLPFERERTSSYARAACDLGGQSSPTEDRREPRLVIEDAGRRKQSIIY